MIGAIIGDLAASSYERNKNLFYAQLIGSDIELSTLGCAIKETTELLFRNPNINS